MIVEKIPKITQLGNNQFIIENDKGKYFQSYKSIIAFVPKDRNAKIKLDRLLWKCSMTTSKYRNIFLLETTKETQEKINNGEYFLVDLN